MKTLLTGQQRFEVRQHPRNKFWEIYDYSSASYPGRTPELGVVKQGLEKLEDAQAEAARLEELFGTGTQDVPPKKQATGTGKRKTVQAKKTPAGDAAGDQDLEEFKVGTYEMTEDQKKRHEEEVLSGNY